MTGLSVAIGDVKGLAESILKLMAEPALRENMSAAARVRMRELFSAEAMVEGVFKAYRELCERPSNVK